MGQAIRRGPLTSSKTTDSNLDCLFAKKTPLLTMMPNYEKTTKLNNKDFRVCEIALN